MYLTGWPPTLENLEILEKSWNFVRSGKSHGKVMENCKKSWNSWKSHGKWRDPIQGFISNPIEFGSKMPRSIFAQVYSKQYYRRLFFVQFRSGSISNLLQLLQGENEINAVNA